MVLIHEIGFFHGHRGLDRVLSMKLAFFMDVEVRQGGRTVLQARRPTHNYPRGDPVRDNPDRGDPGRGGNAHFADNPCLFTGKMVYLRPHNFRAG